MENTKTNLDWKRFYYLHSPRNYTYIFNKDKLHIFNSVRSYLKENIELPESFEMTLEHGIDRRVVGIKYCAGWSTTYLFTYPFQCGALIWGNLPDYKSHLKTVYPIIEFCCKICGYNSLVLTDSIGNAESIEKYTSLGFVCVSEFYNMHSGHKVGFYTKNLEMENEAVRKS